MTTLIRSAVLTSFTDLAASCGLDARALLVDAGLPQRCLDEPDLKVPARAIAHLLELAAQRGKEPAFGLRLAESRRLSNLGPLGLLVRDEPTLRDALEAVMHHIHVVAQHLGVDRRTVARRLADEQTSFSALVNDLRRDLFARYLKDGARSLTDVSALLGFSASSAFSRWHRQQFGIAARQLRSQRAGTARS